MEPQLELSKLCDTCATIFQGTPTGGFLKPKANTTYISSFTWCRWAHHVSFEALWAAARDGCHLCAMSKRFRMYGRVDSYEPSSANLVQSVARGGKIEFNLRPQKEWIELDLWPHVSFRVLPYDPPLIRTSSLPMTGGDYRQFSHRTDDLGPWTLAWHWIERCRTTHPKCNNTYAQSDYPSRLLHVGTDDNDIRLHITAEEQTLTGYFTLSHCWGTAEQPLRLTLASYNDMRRCVPIAQLPQTYRDAILFARFCKVQYIWIDSLCIIQDSIGDWVSEALRMAAVYAGSLCNINATASFGPSGGCFKTRDPRLVMPLLVRPRGHWLTVTKDMPHVLYPQFIWQRNIEDAPLNARAWVMQERLLSPRQLHCAADQLFWECHEGRASEMFPSLHDWGAMTSPDERPSWAYRDLCQEVKSLSSLRPYRKVTQNTVGFSTREAPLGLRNQLRNSFGPVSQPPLVPSPSPVQTDPSHETEPQFYEHWGELIKTYSSLRLSYETDRLKAVAGVASIVGKTLGDSFLGGVWKSQLPYQLLWYKYYESADDQIRLVEVAPSWSWAGWSGKLISPPEHSSNGHERVWVSINGIDSSAPKTQLSIAPDVRLRMRGFLFPYETQEIWDRRRLDPTYQQYEPWFSDTRVCSSVHDREAWMSEVFNNFHLNVPRLSSPQDLYIMPVTSSGENLSFLFLTREGVGSRYERVGAGCIGFSGYFSTLTASDIDQMMEFLEDADKMVSFTLV